MSELDRSIEVHVHDWRLLDLALGMRGAIGRLDAILAEQVASGEPEPDGDELVDAVLGLISIRNHLEAALMVADAATEVPIAAPPAESLFR